VRGFDHRQHDMYIKLLSHILLRPDLFLILEVPHAKGQALRYCRCTKYLSSTKFDRVFHTELSLAPGTEYLVSTLMAILIGTVFVPTSTYVYSKSPRNEFRVSGYLSYQKTSRKLSPKQTVLLIS
jgi:hypothetical protein